ncbi:unnamed protein product [Spirodela intermedia]|uniref:Uncharacterized protein n=1 Tax=Spirodela intermedia TaxID=51605 RepID=A0A7I8LBA9_SPIIN|nr:unnamed protein product [Spirodela intermedia]
MHQPGIEPGSVPWQGTILPLDHWCGIYQSLSSSIALSHSVCLSLSVYVYLYLPLRYPRQPLSPDQGKEGAGRGFSS